METGAMMVMLNRMTIVMLLSMIPKGGIDRVKAQRIAGILHDKRGGDCRRSCATASARSKAGTTSGLLTVAVDRLPHWHRPGLLCIGDAAHAMSPIGGVRRQPRDSGRGSRRSTLLAVPLKERRVTNALARSGAAAAHHADARDPVVEVEIQNNVLSAVLEERRAAEVCRLVTVLQLVSAIAAYSGKADRPKACGPNTSARRMWEAGIALRRYCAASSSIKRRYGNAILSPDRTSEHPLCFIGAATAGLPAKAAILSDRESLVLAGPQYFSKVSRPPRDSCSGAVTAGKGGSAIGWSRCASFCVTRKPST